MSSTPDIPDEGKFVAALGINPDAVVAGSVRITFEGGVPYLQYTAITRVDPLALARAFASCMPMPDPVEETETPTPPAED